MFAADNNYDAGYTYNEEYQHAVPEAPSESPAYLLSSDSENEPSPEDENRSSSCSSDYDEEDYFYKYKRLVQPKYLDMERSDDETHLIIPLERNHIDFSAIPTDKHGKMKCTVCATVFNNKLRYGIHQLRHFARDHFRCPECSKGFTKLSQCQAHELKEHDNKDGGASSNNLSEKRSYSFRTRNARKTNVYNENLEFDEEDMTVIVPSTTLYPYRGPKVVGPFKSYEIEVKYGRSERKSHSKMQAKFVLETQKRIRRDLARKEAKLALKAKQDAEKAALREKRRAEMAERLNNGENADGDIEVIDLDRDFPNKTTRHSARAHPLATRKPLFSPNELNGPRTYFCSLCGFNSEEKLGIHAHQEQVHPEVPVSQLINFLCIDKSLREKKEKPKSPEADEESSSFKRARGRPKGTRNKIDSTKLAKAEKKKDAKLFRKRRHIPRVWERPVELISKEEFIFALGLVKKSDVLVGPRKRQSVISSTLLRQGRRGASPAPPMEKSLKIQMERSSIKHKKVFLCNHCSYNSSSKTEVRNHRRNEHLKHLRQSQDPSEENHSVKKHKHKHKKKKKNGTLPPSASSASDTASNPLINSSTTAAASSSSNSSGVKRYSCVTCDFVGFSRTEIETHELSLHSRTLQLQVSEIPQELIAQLLRKQKNGTSSLSVSTAASSSSSSASSSRSTSPPRKKTKVLNAS